MRQDGDGLMTENETSTYSWDNLHVPILSFCLGSCHSSTNQFVSGRNVRGCQGQPKIPAKMDKISSGSLLLQSEAKSFFLWLVDFVGTHDDASFCLVQNLPFLIHLFCYELCALERLANLYLCSKINGKSGYSYCSSVNYKTKLGTNDRFVVLGCIIFHLCFHHSGATPFLCHDHPDNLSFRDLRTYHRS